MDDFIKEWVEAYTHEVAAEVEALMHVDKTVAARQQAIAEDAARQALQVPAAVPVMHMANVPQAFDLAAEDSDDAPRAWVVFECAVEFVVVMECLEFGEGVSVGGGSGQGIW